MEQTKQRHGCLTAWLVLVIIANSLTAVGYLFARDALAVGAPGAPPWAFALLAVAAAANVVFAVAIFRWKRWGFYGLVGTSILALVANVAAGVNVAQALIGLVGPAVLFGVLQIGNERKGWNQLE
jgi:hypothetical protein